MFFKLSPKPHHVDEEGSLNPKAQVARWAAEQVKCKYLLFIYLV